MSNNLIIRLFIFTSFIFFTETIHAEMPNVNVGGYVQSGSGNRFAKGGELKHDGNNKLRLELGAHINERVSFGANINYVDYFGETSRHLWDWIPDSETNDLPAGDYETHVMEFEDKVYLNDLYMKYDSDFFDFTMGKQQLVMGVGYAFNPLDVMNIKNIMDPAYEPSGHTGYRFDFSLGTHSSLTMFYGQEEYASKSTKILKLDNTFDSLSFSFLAGERVWTFTDYYKMNDIGVDRRFAGSDVKKNIAGIDLWAEVMYNWMEDSIEYKDSKDYIEAVAGVGKTYGDKAEIIVEYYRYGLADTDMGEYDINDWFGYFYGQKKSISRDTVFATVSYTVNEHFIINPYILHSLNDGSVKINPNCTFPVNESFELVFVGALPRTKQAKAFNFYGGTGFMVLGRYTF
jgi:hypothetical protein